MADVSSLYPQPPGPSKGFNVLQANPLEIAGQINSLQKFNAEFGAKKAIGGAYQNALRPDGSVDMEKLSSDLQKDPAAAYGLPEAVSTMLSQRGAQMEQAAKRQQFVADSFSLIDPEKPTREQVLNWTTTFARNNPDIPSAVVNSLAQTALNDPKGLAHGVASLRNYAIGSSGTSGRVSGPPASTGAPTTISTGEANFRPGGIATAQPPGVSEAANVAGAGSGGALNEARNHGINYQAQVFPLESAIPALERLGKTGTGPGTEEFNHLKSFLQSAGIPGLNVDKIKDFDEAKKYLTDFVNQNGNSGTNDKLAAAFAGNPSVGISNAAAVDVAKAALSLRRFKQAQLVSFENSGKPESDFTKEAGKFARDHDPRAYGFDLMTPAQRKSVLDSLPKGKRELFMLDVQDAANSGLIKAPQAK